MDTQHANRYSDSRLGARKNEKSLLLMKVQMRHLVNDGGEDNIGLIAWKLIK